MGYAARGGDCSDDPFMDPEAFEVHPGVIEICNLIDDDCDLSIDEGLTCDCDEPGMEQDCGFDPSLDGIGICRLGTQTCLPEGRFSTCAGATPPLEDELCNLDDDDCDGIVDEGAVVTCFDDPDGDGFAVRGAASNEECACPVGTTSVNPADSEDCDEGNASVHPGATEVCNRIDDDCSSGGGTLLAEDRDDDGHTEMDFVGCTGGFPVDDCNDFDGRVFPGQTMYFTIPICLPTLCACGSACNPRGPIGTCPMCPSGANGSVGGTYDFDCNGTQDPQPSAASCSSCIPSDPPTACLGSGPSYSTAPRCGNNVSWQHCGTGSCGACSGAMSPTLQPLPGR
jgi:hypothetical protein